MQEGFAVSTLFLLVVIRNKPNMKKSSIVCSSFSPNRFGSPLEGVSSAAEFGWAVAVNCDGSQVLVGSANDPSAVYMFDHNGEILRAYHNPHGTNAEHAGVSSRFGFAIKMNFNGKRILIGDPAFNVVYLYDDRGHLMNTFEPFEPFVPPHADVEAMFGAALAINDDATIVAIGAQSQKDITQVPSGAVYLFHQLDGEKWSLATIISNQWTPVANGGFGVSLALSPDGSLLLIGAWNERETQGAAYLYRINQEPTIEFNDGANDDEEHQLHSQAASHSYTFTSPNPSTAKWFGWTVDLTDQYAIIGARGEKQNHKKDAGAVHIFSLTENDTETESSYMYLDSITQPLPVESEQFGAAVSAAGNRILVASYSDGTAYWYESATTYTEAAQSNKTFFTLKEKIPVPTLIPSTTSFSGAAVALSRNGRVGVVGIPRALGRNGYMTTGSVLTLCLPEPEEDNADFYTCPDLDLPAVSWTDVKAFWFSWDSNSGKILAFIGTMLLCLLILFYGSKHHQQRRRRYVFHQISTEATQENDIELRAIQEESEFL
jgi:hypothetical protein